jgi:uncharacterized protein YqeY
MLRLRVQDEIKVAMKAGDKPRLAVLRLLSAAVKQREVDERIELDDTQMLAVLEKMVKQRRESIDQYTKGGRADLAEQEEFEIGILRDFMPELLSAEAVDAIIAEVLTEVGAASMKDMGKVMGPLKAKLQGRADMGQVSAQVKAKLSG